MKLKYSEKQKENLLATNPMPDTPVGVPVRYLLIE
jgi:hypothetical protein